MIKGIIFDLDNTLVDSIDSITKCANHVLKGMGKRGIDRTTAEEAMGLTIFDLFAMVEPNLSEDEKAQLFIDYRRCYMDFIGESRILPHARETLSAVASRGMRLALVTTKSVENARKILKTFGLDGFFTAVVGFEDTMRHKPSPDPLLKALDKIGLGASEVLVVGDTEMDIIAGSRAGARTVAVTTGVTLRERLVLEKPDYIIDDLLELDGILDNLLQLKV
jgi:HAD superfamily hydrolase (TIGR01549 family)